VLRTGLAALALLGFVLVTGGAARTALADARRRPAHAALLALISSAAPFLLTALGQQHVPAGLTGVLIASVPLWTALLALRLDVTQAVDRRQGAGLLTGLAGVALVVGVGSFESPAQAIGVLVILLAAGSYALMGLLVTRWYAGVPAATRGVFASSGAAVMTLPVATATASGGGGPISAQAIAAIVLLGIGSTAVVMALGFRLIDELGPRRAALATYLGPAFSLGLGGLLLGEAISSNAILGFALIVAGVVAASGERRTRAAGDAGAGACPRPSPA
jgi:drug/metabolite transporter (DMT)-like permease